MVPLLPLLKGILVSLFLPLFLSAQTPLVSTKKGTISGFQTEKGINVYKGIPFAAPPVGDLRWKAPQPVKSWEGVKPCTDWGPSPMQGPPRPFMFWSQEFLIPEKPISEDCLYLNVWTGVRNGDKHRPVLVYIYGGGFRSGGSGCPIYDGEAMAQKGVVFVSINYRVGTFGFLAHPELSEEAEYGSSGNYALLDMIAALKWVQENIQAFGGDPQNVTIAGQSAGAFAVSNLTTSPLAKGLFHQAIAQSGGSFVSSPLRPRLRFEEAEQQGLEYAQNTLKCNSLTELRAKPADEILQAQGGLMTPIVDGYVLPNPNAESYREQKHHDVPLLLGWNADDKIMWQAAPVATFKSNIQAEFGDLANEVHLHYPITTEEQAVQSQFDLGRDQIFGVQAYVWAKLQDQFSSSPVYVYNFNRQIPFHSPETNFGAFHSGEIVYAYNNLHTLDRPWDPIDQQIADNMSSYWVNFAKTGNPNGEGLAKWEAFSREEQNVLLIDVETHTKALPDRKALEFLEKFYKGQH